MLTWSPARVYSTITNGYLGPTLTQPVRKRSCIMISVRRNSRDDNHEAHITVHCMLNVGLVSHVQGLFETRSTFCMLGFT